MRSGFLSKTAQDWLTKINFNSYVKISFLHYIPYMMLKILDLLQYYKVVGATFMTKNNVHIFLIMLINYSVDIFIFGFLSTKISINACQNFIHWLHVNISQQHQKNINLKFIKEIRPRMSQKYDFNFFLSRVWKQLLGSG